MEFISQAVRIALGLIVVLVAGIMLAPAQPTLFAAREEGPPAVTARKIVAVAEPVAEPPAVAPAPPPVEQTAEATPSPPAAPMREAEPVTPPAPAETDVPPAPVSEEPLPSEPEAAVAEEAGPQAASLAELTAEPPPLDFRLYREPQVATATTLRADGRDIRLAGLEILPAAARCASGSACGEAARRAVSGFLAGRSVICSVAVGRAEASEITAPCLAGEDDIGEWIVRNGWADAGPGSRYEEAAETARAERLGIWAEGGPAIGATTGN